MAIFFNLTRKSAPEAGPVDLHKLDEEIAALVGMPVHPIRYCCSWFDAIGYWLAAGKTWAEIAAMHESYRSPDDTPEDKASIDRIVRIREWLEANFIAEGWGR